MDKQELLSLSKKLKVIWAALAWRFPSRRLKSWAEDTAIFQSTLPVTINDMGLASDSALPCLRRAFGQGLLEEIDIPDYQSGFKLHAWFLKPLDKMPTVIYSYGNSSNLSEAKYLMNSFAGMGFGFLGWSYPGYELSEGMPSEQNLYKGLKTVSNYLVSTQGIRVSDQIAMGHSLGGLVTTHVAMSLPFRLIVLMNTPPNIPDYYEHLVNDLPLAIRWMFAPKENIKQRFDAASKLPLVKSPVLFICSDKDEELPLDMARTLFSLSQAPSYKHIILGANHDLEVIPRFAEEICRAVSLHKDVCIKKTDVERVLANAAI